ncbi:hypothetical protein KRP22_007969 [Phytophthora ramorum]|nr:hypothetical protein KRP22_4020 [Phytophthora ramorum]
MAASTLAATTSAVASSNSLAPAARRLNPRTHSSVAIGVAAVLLGRPRFKAWNPSGPTQTPTQNTASMPKSHSTGDTGAAVEDHAAMKKQWQTNLEIDLLKSAWIRKDREQHGAHTSPPLSAGK